MKKLILIRPWRLQTVRQKAVNEIHTLSPVTTGLISCKGPEANISEMNGRACFTTTRLATMTAPVSDLIFATGNNPRW